VPPLEQPSAPLLPAGVFTTTVKLPGAGMAEAVTVAVSWVLLTTVLVSVTPLNSIVEDETKCFPVAVITKLGGSWEKISVSGQIEVRLGSGRALPHRGFSALQPGRLQSTTTKKLTRPIRREEGMS
jgi:hypothetical protein